MAEVNHVSPVGSPDVFLSYSRNDAELVEKIAEGLEKAGFSCWIDTENLRHNDDFNIKIQEGIRNCLVFISFLSRSYVNKPYCFQEFAMAREENKSVLSVTIDDVSKNTNRDAAYMFGFRAGKTNKNYGKSLSVDDVPFVVDFLIDTYQLTKLKKFYSSGDENDIPSPNLPSAVMDKLRFYLDKQFELRENYALGEVSGILFPAVRDVKTGELLRDENEEMTSLTRYLADRLENGERSSLFVYGEGGMGKTVAMLETAKYLLSRGIPAIYIPLSKMKTEEAIYEYIDVTVLGGSDAYKKILYDFMGLDMEGEPSVVLLFDGVNELTADTEKAKQIVYRIRENFIDSYEGTEVIISSRWDDPEVTGQIKDAVTPLEMQRFDTARINRYLKSVGVAPVVNPKMLSVLSTPLLLTLYANVEQHIGKYGAIKGIELYETPDSPAKILRNFFLTQLFRASAEPYFDKTSHFVLLEYLLPAIAFEAVKDKSAEGRADSERVYELIEEIEDKEGRYLWFRKDVLRKFTGGNTKVDTDLLLPTAVSSLHFLVPRSDAGYEFIHQSFRDYFAAYHIVNEVNAFENDPDRAEEEDSVLTFRALSDDILSLAADIADENRFMPVKNTDGIDLHGKAAPDDESESAFENALGLFRGQEGEKAQNAVYNLFNIISIGRGGDLSFCDFSRLDMRKCVLAKARFTCWHGDKIYPAVFDGSFINTEAFIRDGHSAAVSALATDGDDLIFSGDTAGNIRICSISEHRCKKTLTFSDEPVNDIAYHPETRRIAAVSRTALLEYYPDTDELRLTENARRDQDFRYVRFDKNGKITVSHTLEPLVFRYLTGELAEGFPGHWGYDVPAGCAVWHPTQEKFVRSRIAQSFSAVIRADDGISWWMHPAFKDVMLQKASDFSAEELLRVKNAFDEPKKSKDYFCLKTTCKEAPLSYILRIDNDLYLYDSAGKRILKKIGFYKGIDSMYAISNLISVTSEGKALYFDMQLSLYTAMFSLRYFNEEFNAETVKCMSFNADGSRLLICIGNLLLEIDFDTLTLVKKTRFEANVYAACYCADKIIVGVGTTVQVLTANHTLLRSFEGSNQRAVTSVVEDIEGDGCYVLTNGNTIKKLDSNLVLQRIRSVRHFNGFQWAKHCISGKIYMLGRATPEYPFGRIFDFETGEIQPMDESYRVIDVIAKEEDNKYYPVGNKVLAFNKLPPYNKIFFTNYSGIHIYGCSFRSVKGSIAGEKGKEFIKSNGGLTDV